MNDNRHKPAVPKYQLEHGKYYYGHCRNATVARWNAETQKFYYWRNKFGRLFVEEICCPEDEKRYDVFVVERVCNEPPKEIPF